MKNIDVIKELLLLILLSMIFSAGICEDDAKVTPTPTATPEPTPTACCPDESSLVAEFYDPKTKMWVGEMTDVTLSSGGIDITESGRCVEWEGPGMEVIIYAGGGDDTDYCIDTETGMPVRTLHPDVTFSWVGTGYVDSNDDRIFHLVPTGPGTYVVSVMAEDGGDCNAGMEFKWAQCQIIVYRVLGISGPSEIIRAETASYGVTVEGLSPETVYWDSNYYYVEGSSPEWHGKIVTNTYIDCTVYLKCPFTQQHIFIGLERFITFCNDREDEEWDIIVGDCEESSEQYPINNTTDLGYLCNKFSAGRHRDKTTNADLAFYPNAYHDNGEPGESPEEVLELVCRGVLIVEITDSGPNDGLWYVSSSSFVVDQEFITNKWIRPDGPNPPGADINWYGQNLLYCNDQFGYDITGAIGVAGWYQTIKDHENEGNHLASNGAGSGHHAQMRYDEETHRDLREAVEEFVSYSEISIKLAVANKFADIEDVVDGDPNHTYVKENWCPEVSAECIIYEATYDPVEMEWKSCFACKNTENQ